MASYNQQAHQFMLILLAYLDLNTNCARSASRKKILPAELQITKVSQIKFPNTFRQEKQIQTEKIKITKDVVVSIYELTNNFSLTFKCIQKLHSWAE